MPNIRRSRESWNRSSSFLYDNNSIGTGNGGHNHGENIVWSFVAECAPEAPRKIEKALEIVRRRTSSDSFRDQTDKVAIHTQTGIEFLERYANFVKDRSIVELDYAKQLNGLVRKYLPKKKEEEDPPFTYAKAFNNVLNELQGVANQHELIAENFRQNILTEIASICRDLKEHRKTHLSEITRLQQNFDSSVDQMNKMKKDYTKAFKESEAAQFKYDKAEADMNLSRAEVEKAKSQAISKNQMAEDAKNSYAFQLRKTNDLQTQHFNFLLPNVLEKLREMDESRIKNVRKIIIQCVEIERNVLPIIERCLQCMAQHANDIKADSDSQEVISRYRSGYGLPSDYAFIDLSAEGSSEIIAASPNSNNIAGRKERKGSATLNRVQSIGIGKKSNVMPRIFNKKNEESFKEDFSDLQPAQRCKRLQHKLTDIEKQIEKKVAQRDGCIKMQTVYRDNPKLGDIDQVELEIDKCSAELNELSAESQKYQAFLQDAINQMNVPINAPLPFQMSSTTNSVTPSSTRLVPRPQTHSSGSDASSLCHSNSDVSEGVPEKTSSGGTSASHGSSASPEHRRIYNGDAEVYEAADAEYGTGEPEVVLGTCKALYDFSAGSEGMLPMKESQEFLLLERDAGDGWTKIRGMDNHLEGFVPTTYLECHFYPI